MSERADDIEYIMARIYAMKEARKNLDREIREDEKYLNEFMEGKEEHITRSYKASKKTFSRKSLKTMDEIALIINDENVMDRLTKASEVSYVSVEENIDFEPYQVDDLNLIPAWARVSYIELQLSEEASA